MSGRRTIRHLLACALLVMGSFQAKDKTNATAAIATIYGLAPADLGPELTRYVRETLAHPPDAPKERLKKAKE